MQRETRLLLLDAIRQCRAELMAAQSWLQDEVAELRKELAASRAELRRLRAAQRDPLSVSAAQSMSASLRKRPNCCVAAKRRYVPGPDIYLVIIYPRCRRETVRPWGGSK